MTTAALADLPELLTTSEVAALFRVDPKTVTRWGDAGLLGQVIRTPGGHRRVRAEAVRARFTAHQAPAPVVSGYEGQPSR